MPTPAHYRRIHSLLLNPDTAILVTTSGGRYLIDRSVLVCVSGPAAMPASAWPNHAPAITVGYIMPVKIRDDDRYPAEYLAQRTGI